MSDIQAPNGFETNETLDGAADVMEVFQPGSGGVRRNKKALLDTLGTFFTKYLLRRTIVTTDITMVSPKNYLVSGDFDLTLPSSPVEGDTINILADGFPKIIQDDAEHVINYKDRHFTTKGTSGLVQLFSKNDIELVYKGAGLSRIEPPVKVSALTAPEGIGRGCAFSYDGTYLAVAHDTSPYITVYKRTGDAFAKVSALIAPEGGANGCAFSYDGTYLAVAHDTSPYITVYKRTGDAFAKVSALTAPEGDGASCAFSYDGTYLAVAHFNSPYITVYKRTGDAFAKVSALIAPEGIGRGCAFSYDGTYLAVAHNNSPYITVYKRTGDAFAKVSALSTIGGTGNGCAFSYDGTYLAVAHDTSPFITVYKTKESANKVWIASKFETMNPADPSDGDAGDLIYRFV